MNCKWCGEYTGNHPFCSGKCIEKWDRKYLGLDKNGKEIKKNKAGGKG